MTDDELEYQTINQAAKFVQVCIGVASLDPHAREIAGELLGEHDDPALRNLIVACAMPWCFNGTLGTSEETLVALFRLYTSLSAHNPNESD